MRCCSTSSSPQRQVPQPAVRRQRQRQRPKITLADDGLRVAGDPSAGKTFRRPVPGASRQKKSTKGQLSIAGRAKKRPDLAGLLLRRGASRSATWNSACRAWMVQRGSYDPTTNRIPCSEKVNSRSPDAENLALPSVPPSVDDRVNSLGPEH